MSTPQHILDDAELAKNYIIQSNMTDEYKRTYLRLIKVSTMATNGISSEEKIQMMTECISLLAITQGMYLSNIDSKIQNAIAKASSEIDTKIEKAISAANSKQCTNCKAMKHANDIEQEEYDMKLLQSYAEKNGININDLTSENNNSENTKSNNQSWQDIIKQILLKPYIYVVCCLITVSPYGVDILKALLHFFDK